MYRNCQWHRWVSALSRIDISATTANNVPKQGRGGKAVCEGADAHYGVHLGHPVAARSQHFLRDTPSVRQLHRSQCRILPVPSSTKGRQKKRCCRMARSAAGKEEDLATLKTGFSRCPGGAVCRSQAAPSNSSAVGDGTQASIGLPGDVLASAQVGYVSATVPRVVPTAISRSCHDRGCWLQGISCRADNRLAAAMSSAWLLRIQVSQMPRRAMAAPTRTTGKCRNFVCWRQQIKRRIAVAYRLAGNLKPVMTGFQAMAQ